MKVIPSIAIMFSILVMVFAAAVDFNSVRADSVDPISFSSGVTIFSPVNMTYASRDLVLNVTFGFGLGVRTSFNYSVDGNFQGPINFTYLTPTEMHIINRAIATIEMPELNDGSHYISINVLSGIYDYHGANPPGAPFKPSTPGSSDYIATWTHTVYFTISSPQPTNFSSPTPTSTPISYIGTSFSTLDQFAIPKLSGTIKFAYRGSYNSATLENDFWNFHSLSLEGPHPTLGGSHSLIVSAQNCEITITHVDTLTWLDQVGWLTYNVNGVGNQTFNMHWLSKGFPIGFKVYIDGMDRERGDGWTISRALLSVIGAKQKVSVGYSVNGSLIGDVPDFEPSPSPAPSQTPSNPPPTATPSPTIPEFPALTALPFAATLTLIVYVIGRNKGRKIGADFAYC